MGNPLTGLSRLVRSWWTVDRIRVSPREGRILRMKPPCLVRIRGRFVQVLGREVGLSHRGADLLYRCEVDDEEATLSVDPIGPVGTRRIFWSHGSERLEIREEEMEFWG